MLGRKSVRYNVYFAMQDFYMYVSSGDERNILNVYVAGRLRFSRDGLSSGRQSSMKLCFSSQPVPN